MLQFLKFSGVQFHNYQHQDVVHMVGSTSGSLPQYDSNGMEVLVRVVVLVTDMVDVMLLLFVMFNTDLSDRVLSFRDL